MSHFVSRETLFLTTRTPHVPRLFIFGATCLFLVNIAVVALCSSEASKRNVFLLLLSVFQMKSGWLWAPQADQGCDWVTNNSWEVLPSRSYGELRGSRASSVQSCPAWSKCAHVASARSFSGPALRREQASGYWRIREWKGLSLLCKNGLKKLQEIWTYFSKLWQFCSSGTGWLWSLALFLAFQSSPCCSFPLLLFQEWLWLV